MSCLKPLLVLFLIVISLSVRAEVPLVFWIEPGKSCGTSSEGGITNCLEKAKALEETVVTVDTQPLMTKATLIAFHDVAGQELYALRTHYTSKAGGSVTWIGRVSHGGVAEGFYDGQASFAVVDGVLAASFIGPGGTHELVRIVGDTYRLLLINPELPPGSVFEPDPNPTVLPNLSVESFSVWRGNRWRIWVQAHNLSQVPVSNAGIVVEFASEGSFTTSADSACEQYEPVSQGVETGFLCEVPLDVGETSLQFEFSVTNNSADVSMSTEVSAYGGDTDYSDNIQLTVLAGR